MTEEEEERDMKGWMSLVSTSFSLFSWLFVDHMKSLTMCLSRLESHQAMYAVKRLISLSPIISKGKLGGGQTLSMISVP